MFIFIVIKEKFPRKPLTFIFKMSITLDRIRFRCYHAE